MGRKKEPSALKRLRGSDGRYINDQSPTFAVVADIKPPAILGRHGKKYWREVAPILIEYKLLTAGDLGAFTNLCVAWDLAMEALATIKAEGLFRQDENNVTRKHPAHQVWRDSLAQYLRLCGEFGLTPAARESLHLELEEEDPYEQYLKRRGDE